MTRLISVPVLFFLFSSIVFSQNTLLIDDKIKKEVVYKVASIMQEKYVFADIGEKMAKHIVKQYKNGKYTSYTKVKPFCSKLTSDLREICNDKHIFVFYSPDEAKDVAARNNLLHPDEINAINEYYELIDGRENYGFKKVEILEGNIGYAKINYISGSENALDKVNNVLAFLSNTDAIILDLRDNGGGGGSGADLLLMSYFFGEEKVAFTGVYLREQDSIIPTWSLNEVPGSRLPDVDLYVLTSSRTFSAAENICYSLQALKRAVIIGESTKGGAHPIDVFIVNGDILTQVSIGNSVNPITGTNWESSGVKPNVEVQAKEALNKAHVLAIEKLIKKIPDKVYKQELKSILNKLINNTDEINKQKKYEKP